MEKYEEDGAIMREKKQGKDESVPVVQKRDRCRWQRPWGGRNGGTPWTSGEIGA